MGNARVLVCEDDNAIQTLLETLLRRHGLSVVVVRTGIEAVDRLRRESYDLILLDLLTPGMNGFQVLELLREERPDLLDRVVVISAFQTAFTRGLPARVAALIRKPFDLAEFDLVIERVLLSSRAQRDMRRIEGGL